MLKVDRIKNPLRGIPKDQLLLDVDTFATEHDLTDIRDLLRKGAVVAQSPFGLEHLIELDDTDRTVLRDEIVHRWRHPKILYFTIVMNSIAAAIQGWDQVCHRQRPSTLSIADNLIDRKQWCQPVFPTVHGYPSKRRLLRVSRYL